MFNAMKYIKVLEAVGFQREQAEAQVQLVLEVFEAEVVTKSEFKLFQQHVDSRFDAVDHRFDQLLQKISESESRLLIRLGFVAISCTTIAVTLLTWLIKLY